MHPSLGCTCDEWGIYLQIMLNIFYKTSMNKLSLGTIYDRLPINDVLTHAVVLLFRECDVLYFVQF